MLSILAVTFLSITANAQFDNLDQRVEHYTNTYQLSDPYVKKVDNYGNGFAELYGTRNFRVVLNGVLYRGGGNNVYHKSLPRDNRNPLPQDGLENLCEEGFESAIYLYSTNFSSAPGFVDCKSRRQITKKNSLNYKQVSPLYGDGPHEILSLIFDNIKSPNVGPIYAHCWNGWHASGFISALALKQFCGWGTDEAVNYWDKNTDGVNTDPNYEKIRNKIRNFNINAKLSITKEEQTLICPQ